MARGSAAGEPIQSQAQTKEWDEGYERIFGAHRKPERGRWVWDPARQQLVPAHEYTQPPTEIALHAPVMAGRFYENTVVVGTGEDIGSRKRHREYMHKNGLTTADDFTETWKQAAKDREQRQQGIFPDARERRNEVGKIWYEVEKRKNARRR